ncbi:LPS export ABC transporter ATP-binding protein [Prochlorococcus marinus]|uniref:Possible ABC transporter, ATP binding component n=1 Tax=Prochlorococcus marinus (strain MIT 9211) TaxID=93059 RepID=A9BAR8_PROM4|nr:LPS export ABC transporter ATP-binding protein [Prochlorococcus marinus]ABX08930.1 possible ABC transporter, ATP binding component [Prochlorococcus marinus str. MIT 9211]
MSLQLKDVSRSISGRKVVNNISLEVTPGEVVGLLGPNGAGKTTSFNLIIGFLRPDFGQVFLEGKKVTQLSMPSRAKLGVGYLPQEASIFRQLTVHENLDIALSQAGMSTSLSRIRREKIIEEFNLSGFLHRRGYQLSGGERRRCEVARAVALGPKGPKYLLLDEPFAGVDPMAVVDLQILIENIKSRGMGILITDHNVRETLAITDRSYILSEGKILASGSSSEVSNNSLVRRHYLGEKFKL